MRVSILPTATFLALILLCLLLNNRCYFEDPSPETNIISLQAALSSSRECVRSKAALDVQKLGKAGIYAVPQLLKLLDDPVASVRWRSVAALGHINYFPREVRDAVFKMIDDAEETTRLNTIFAVSRMTFDPPTSKYGLSTPTKDYEILDAVLDIYLRGLSDPVPRVKYKTLIHLNMGQIKERGGKYPLAFLASLLELADDTEEVVQGMALIQLGDLLGSDKVQEKIPDYRDRIAGYLNSDNELVKKGAYFVMEKIEGKKYPFLLRASKEIVEKTANDCESGQLASGACFELGQYYLHKGIKYLEKDCSSQDMHLKYGCEILGDFALAAGNRKEAERLYHRVAPLQGTKNPALIKIGELYEKDGNLTEACYWYNLSCANGMDLGCTKGKQCNEHEKVVRASQLRSSPDRTKGMSLYSAANEALNVGDRTSAVALHSDAHQSGSVISTLALASIYLQSGKKDDAIRVLTEACDFLEPQACGRLGALHESYGDAVKAEEAYKQACHLDRPYCSNNLADLELRRGNRKGAEQYLTYLCHHQLEGGKKEACDKLKELQEHISIDENLIISCKEGNNTDCRIVAEHYSRNLDYDKALDFHRRACDIKKNDFNCRSFFDELLRQQKWDEYRRLGEEICLLDKEACLRGPWLDANRNDTNSAIAGYEKLCVNNKIPKACNRMQRLAINTKSSDELKEQFSRWCETNSEVSSCSLLAAIYSREGDNKKMNQYFDKAIELAQIKCKEGELDYCAGVAFNNCAKGQINAGEENLKALCKESNRYCKYVEKCSYSLRDLLDQLVPRM